MTFITASSFLGGPGFVGMREMMRREFDEIYIINLGGDLLGTRKTPNVFNIQTPVAITIGRRGLTPNRDNPAVVRYVRIEAEDRGEKLAKLTDFDAFDQFAWEDISREWHDPFYPRSDADYFFWPELADVFPWQHSGAQFKRVWPIAESKELVLKRWSELNDVSDDERANKLFKATASRSISKQVRGERGKLLKPVKDLGRSEVEGWWTIICTASSISVLLFWILGLQTASAPNCYRAWGHLRYFFFR